MMLTFLTNTSTPAYSSLMTSSLTIPPYGAVALYEQLRYYTHVASMVLVDQTPTCFCNRTSHRGAQLLVPNW